MNTGNIVEKFELLSGIEGSESIKWRSVVDDACAYVYSRIADKPLSASDERRIELLCAVYAYKLYVMCGKSEVSSFKAGDVTVTAPADEGDKAEKLWQDQLVKCSDLIKKEGFLFGRVVT